jgi:dienelactone hydrolase
MLGVYGAWAAGLTQDDPLPLSWRHDDWDNLDIWRSTARARVAELLASPPTGGTPDAAITASFRYDGLVIESLTWRLPYGPPTEALLLKPAGAVGPLPGVLALHDHAGNKAFGKRKITRTTDQQHPVMIAHRERYYDSVAWANELAKRGYAVLVPDAFAFASRRLRVADMPPAIRPDFDDSDLDDPTVVEAYNAWAKAHESILAKSLFSAGTTWPGVFLGEDQRALDVLCARPEVDAARVGCAGLSGGGLRTAYLGGMDERIQCAVCVGMMTTWRDYLLHKSHTHTWMIYIPHLARELDYPEVFGLRVPLPTMVLSDIDDELFTLPEMERADRILGEIFGKAGASDQYRCHFHPGPHKFDLPMQAQAFDWFDRWLK